MTRPLRRLAAHDLLAPLAAAVLLAPIAVAQDAARDATAGDAPGMGGAETSGAPVVRTAEDFLALDHRDRARVGRAARPKRSVFVEGGVRWSSPADLDDATGDVSVSRLGVGAGMSFRLSDTADLIFRVNAEHSHYDFDNAGGLVPGQTGDGGPFDDVYQVDLSPMLRVLPDDGFQYQVAGRVRTAAEPGADFGESLIGGGFATFSYPVTDTLRLGAGVNVNSRLDGGIFVLPIPIVRWDITDDLVLRTREAGVGLEYWINDGWNVAALVGFFRREYRLDDDGPTDGGSVIDRRIPLTLAVTYAPSPKMFFTAQVGAELWGELQFSDADDNDLADTDLGANAVVAFDFRYSF